MLLWEQGHRSAGSHPEPPGGAWPPGKAGQDAVHQGSAILVGGSGTLASG